jgi:integration host factor subunit beta
LKRFLVSGWKKSAKIHNLSPFPSCPAHGRDRGRQAGGNRDGVREREERNMNKAELITKVSEKANVTQKVAKVIVDTLFDGMKESLEKGERIEIRGFGSFVVRSYGGYKGRNPKTGEIVEVPPKKLPFFKVGKELKEMVNIEGA